ncbi:MAG: molybdenum cofactor guanylyltransferase [Clostridia bacterium]|jgi:molybdenum cofactor guanylyltransferase|nr:molybdenum cofactor guanylyltransferase [Clostridia bacterium]
MTGIILAGGKATRMGQDKARIVIDGRAIIDSAIAVLAPLFSEVIIVSNSAQKYAYTNLCVVKDDFADKGVLGGIYTGLKRASCDKCFVTACDMPYIEKDLVAHLMSYDGYDVVVPVVNGYYEPLLAQYSKNCLSRIEKALEEGNLKVSDFYEGLNVKEVGEEEISMFDKKLRSFVNMNTPHDLKL